MPQKSAGLLLYRFNNNLIEYFIVHPGGPFWTKKDIGAWSIPKGIIEDNEDPLKAAIREFEEETGAKISGNFISLTPVKMKSGKIIYAFAIEYDLDITQIKSNTFTMEWPPKSGKKKEFPEIDKGEWLETETCILKLNDSQKPFINELLKIIH